MAHTPLGAVLAISIATIFAGGCEQSIQEASLIGSWRLDGPVRNRVVFTYYKDHTTSLTLPGVKRLQGSAVLGTWRLEGQVLVTVIGGIAGPLGTSSVGMPTNEQRVTITKLTASIMVWQNGVFGKKTTLRRMAPALSDTRGGGRHI